MKTLRYYHFVSMCVYIFGITCGISLFVLLKNSFGIQLPAWCLALVVLLCLVSSAAIRIFAWKKKASFLTKKEQNQFGTKVFFLLAFFEILVAIIGTVIIF